ncbi:MAG: hypothetical protein CMM25_08005 [Rhodospirillaceae bacterium]|nr:hypothetical protein [Rhodospirillaceae bacterium]
MTTLNDIFQEMHGDVTHGNEWEVPTIFGTARYTVTRVNNRFVPSEGGNRAAMVLTLVPNLIAPNVPAWRRPAQEIVLVRNLRPTTPGWTALGGQHIDLRYHHSHVMTDQQYVGQNLQNRLAFRRIHGQITDSDDEASVITYSSSDFGSINYWKRVEKKHRPQGGWKEPEVNRFYRLYKKNAKN